MVPINLEIESSFFLPEERDGYLVSTEMKQVWAVELDLLNEFAQVCKKNNLKWFAHAGTMLGAVRHHGFIPWDDDIDVTMPRDDYERFCIIAPNEFNGPYFFQTDDTDKFFCRNFARLRNSETTAIQIGERERAFPYNQGIFIDIFPYDNISDDDSQLKSDILQIETLANSAWQFRDMVYFYLPKKDKGLRKRANYLIKHLWYKYFNKSGGGNYLNMLQQHKKLVTGHNREETRRVGEMIIPPLGRHIWEKEWIYETISVPFEMLQINVPSDYAQCLNASFGTDWKTPKQAGNYHGKMLFDVNRPYTEYLKKK